jgi:hypothetical protein
VTAVTHEHLSTAELRDLLDAQAREKLGLSAEEFLERCRSRTLDMGSPAVSRLAVLGRLLLTARSLQ